MSHRVLVQVRHRAVDIIADLFSRSKVFRNLLLSRFTTFLELAVGGKVSRPLPQPAAAAQVRHSLTGIHLTLQIT